MVARLGKFSLYTCIFNMISGAVCACVITHKKDEQQNTRGSYRVDSGIYPHDIASREVRPFAPRRPKSGQCDEQRNCNNRENRHDSVGVYTDSPDIGHGNEQQ